MNIQNSKIQAFTLQWFEKSVPLVQSLNYNQEIHKKFSLSTLDQKISISQNKHSHNNLQYSVNSKLKNLLNKIDATTYQQDEGINNYAFGGYCVIHVGQILFNRYVIIQKLGWSHFSTVWLCRDFKYETYVAVKIIKSEQKYQQMGLRQIQILQKANNFPADKKNLKKQKYIINLLNAFMHKNLYSNHICLVFEPLKYNLQEIIKNKAEKKLRLDICKQITKQMLTALTHLHNITNIVHTDIKLSNIMMKYKPSQLKNMFPVQKIKLYEKRLERFRQLLSQNNSPKYVPQSSIFKMDISKIIQQEEILSKNKLKNKKKMKNKIKDIPKTQDELLFQLKQKKEINFKKQSMIFNLIDFGNACFKNLHLSNLIQTREYRAPEVILKHSYCESADIWSLGCTIYEMATGSKLFSPLRKRGININYDHLLQIQQLFGQFPKQFVDRGNAQKYYKNIKQLTQGKNTKILSLNQILVKKYEFNQQEASQFYQFLKSLLATPPENRIDARKALQSLWLNKQIKEFRRPNQAIVKQNYEASSQFENQQQSNESIQKYDYYRMNKQYWKYNKVIKGTL